MDGWREGGRMGRSKRGGKERLLCVRARPVHAKAPVPRPPLRVFAVSASAAPTGPWAPPPSETMQMRYPKSKRRGLAGSGPSRGLGGEGRRGAALVARTPASTRARAHTHAHVCTQQDDCRLLLSPDDAAAVLQVQSGGPGPGVLSAAGGLGMGKESLSL